MLLPFFLACISLFLKLGTLEKLPIEDYKDDSSSFIPQIVSVEEEEQYHQHQHQHQQQNQHQHQQDKRNKNPSIELEELVERFSPEDKVKVTHTIWTNSSSNGELISGKEHELLLLLRNGWFQSITVFSMTPSFRNPNNLDQVLRNITSNRIFIEIPSGQEATLSYKIKPDMDPVSLGLNIIIDYTDPGKNRWFKTIGYSQVIHVTASPASRIYDFSIVFMYLVIFMVLFFFAFQMFYRVIPPPSSKTLKHS